MIMNHGKKTRCLENVNKLCIKFSTRLVVCVFKVLVQSLNSQESFETDCCSFMKRKNHVSNVVYDLWILKSLVKHSTWVDAA